MARRTLTDDRLRQQLTDVRLSVARRFSGVPNNPILSIGEGGRTVLIRLKPNAIQIAEALNEEFSGLVQITVGFKPFPVAEDRSRTTSPCVLEARGSLAALSTTCEVTSTRLRAGEDVTGHVVMQNTGDTVIEGSGSAHVGWLCRPGTLVVVGGYSGAVAGASRMIHIDPGSSDTLSFTAGTASCEPDDRYVVRPGQYEVVVPVDLEARSRRGHPMTVRILARGCFISVT
jgi:hypothetical protein